MILRNSSVKIKSKLDSFDQCLSRFIARRWATKFINNHFGLIKIIASSRKIMYFNNNIWIPLSNHTFHSLVYTWLPSVKGGHLSIGQIDQICSAILLEQSVSIEHWPVSPSHLIQFTNGILDLNTRSLLPISSQYFITQSLPFHVDKSMLDRQIDLSKDCPYIHSWLEFVANGDPNRRIFLLYYLVLVIRGLATSQILLNIIGPGGTGKSVYQLLATALVGLHNTGSTTLSVLEHNRFEIAGLIDKLLIIVADSSHYRGEVSVLKAITGGDPVRIERKYQSAGTATYFGNVIIVGNQPLHVNDMTSGWSRRYIPIEFDRIPTQRLPLISLIKGQFDGLFIPELPYFILYLLSFDTRLVLETMSPDGRAMNYPFLADIAEEVNSSTNSILSFIGSHIEADVSSSLYFNSKMGDSIYPHYLSFCAKSGFSPEHIQAFPNLLYSQLVAFGYMVTKTRDMHGRKLTGIRMKSS